jgi:folate-binding protein YgfZ
MLNGILTNSLPGPFEEEQGGWRTGRVVYSALLTAKGRMVTDLRIHREGDNGFILDIPLVGYDGAVANFKKFLPPRLAKAEDRSQELVLLTLMGPEAPSLLRKVTAEMNLAIPVEGVRALKEGEEILTVLPPGGVFRISRSGRSHAEGWDLLLPASLAEDVGEKMTTAGAVPLTEATLHVLRVEKGRPAFGRDMDEDTIPVEAGIQGRAVDNGKGCYTGQEVIIRIRDRGQVNKQMRGLLLGDLPVPPVGQELFKPDGDKSVGTITSAVASPAFGETIALAYLRRGVGPGDVVRLGSTEGPEVQVRGLGDEGWILD